MFYYFRRPVNNTGLDITKSSISWWLSGSFNHLDKDNIRFRFFLSNSDPICVYLNNFFSCSRVKR